MNKKLIINCALLIFQLNIIAQEDSTKTRMPLNKVELLLSYQLFGGGYGFIVKGKTKILNSNHFESYTGIAYQQSHQSESNKLMVGVEGFNSDMGIHLIAELIYYPFKSKKVFTGIEPYLGLNTLKTEGQIDLPDLNIHSKYSNSYLYVNYGIYQTIGYQHSKISISGFSMLTLNGVLDQGRKRIGDTDSKVFVGINFGYIISRKK